MLKRICLIGFGNIARKHIEVLRALGCEIVASCNRNLEHNRLAEAEAGIPQTFTSYSDMIRRVKPDGVLVCVSFWNNYQVLPKVGAALGIIRRSNMFAAIDDTVTLPGYTRADAAIFLLLTERTRLQLNVENVFNRTYYVNADNNTNISPGSPRAVRVALRAGF